jgi:NAD kinase
MKVLIATKETTKEFFERKYGAGNLELACAEQEQEVDDVIEKHNTLHSNLELLVSAFKDHNINPVIKARVNTQKYDSYKIDDFKEADIVVSFGGDGEVLDVARNITNEYMMNHKPLVWVEPADKGSVAAFSEKSEKNYHEKVGLLINNNYREEEWSRLKGVIKKNNEIVHESIALNEVLIGKKYFSSMARYTISIGDKKEYHLSSGLAISTQAGLTGLLLNIAPYEPIIEKQLMEGSYKADMKSKKLSFKTINPPINIRRNSHMLSGEIEEDKNIIVTSAMNYSGAVAFDGSDPDCPDPRFYDFNRGMTLEVSACDDPLRVIRFEDNTSQVKNYG